VAAEQLPGGPKSIALVDLSYIFSKNWHGTPRDAKPGEAAQATLDQLAAVRESVERVILCCDAAPYWRTEIYPEYKAQRERPDPEMLAQKRWLLERVEKDGYQIAKVATHEADDVIATLCKAYWWCEDVRIVGADKDCAQCVTECVRMYVPAVGQRPAEVRGPKEVREKFGVGPADMPLWLALVGDNSDNLPGVPGVGPKKAAQLIQECKSLAGIREALASFEEGETPSAMWRSVREHIEDVEKMLALTRLREDVPLDAPALLERKEAMPLIPDAETEGEPVPSPAPANRVTAIARTHGETTEDLQPVDLESARTIAKWVHNGRLYPQFPTPESIFTIILRGKELGLGVTTALAGFHLIEGKPAASADLIRSLAERDPDCEWFRLVESSPTSATWETKHRKHPEPMRYTYTLDEANQAGLRGGNWQKRPRDMLCKTAGSKLARIAYPRATMGLCDPDEFEAA
jgi:5'-3' exonuclease